MYTVNCSHPQVILNPKAIEFAVQSEKFFIDGIPHSIDSSQRYSILSGDSVSSVLHLPYVHNIDSSKYKCSDYRKMRERFYNFLENSFFMSPDGVILGNVWMLVPCGKCDVCVSKKVASIVQRCQFAQEETGLQSVFVTLTYNDEHLPSDGLVSRRDCQLFFKRLKVAISRLKILKDSSECAKNLKWFYSSEYGNLGRPHYHCIIHGIPKFSDNPVKDDYYLHWLIYYCWRDSKYSRIPFERYIDRYPKIYNVDKGYDPFSKGYVNVEVAQSSKSVSYILKYVFKSLGREVSVVDGSDFFDFDSNDYISSHVNFDDTNVDERRLFYGCSCNLGVSFVNSHFDSICSSLDGSFTYHSKVYNKLVTCNLSSYYIKKLFPSESKFVSCEVRRRFLRIHYLKYELFRSPELTVKQKSFVCDCIEFVDALFPFLVLSEMDDLRVMKKYLRCDLLVKDCVVEDGLPFLQLIFDKGNSIGLRCANDLLDIFIDDINFLNNNRLDYFDIQLKLMRRIEFFSKLKSRSYDEICDVGRRFSKQNKVSISKSFLQ